MKSKIREIWDNLGATILLNGVGEDGTIVEPKSRWKFKLIKNTFGAFTSYGATRSVPPGQRLYKRGQRYFSLPEVFSRLLPDGYLNSWRIAPAVKLDIDVLLSMPLCEWVHFSDTDNTSYINQFSDQIRELFSYDWGTAITEVYSQSPNFSFPMLISSSKDAYQITVWSMSGVGIIAKATIPYEGDRDQQFITDAQLLPLKEKIREETNYMLAAVKERHGGSDYTFSPR